MLCDERVVMFVGNFALHLTASYTMYCWTTFIDNHPPCIEIQVIRSLWHFHQWCIIIMAWPHGHVGCFGHGSNLSALNFYSVCDLAIKLTASSRRSPLFLFIMARVVVVFPSRAALYRLSWPRSQSSRVRKREWINRRLSLTVLFSRKPFLLMSLSVRLCSLVVAMIHCRTHCSLAYTM